MFYGDPFAVNDQTGPAPAAATPQTPAGPLGASGGLAPLDFGLADEERVAFAHLAQAVNLSRTGLLGDQPAAAFLLKSGLAVSQLSEIWALADTRQRGALDLNDFYRALKLVALAQNGLPVATGYLSARCALPRFSGIDTPSIAAAAPAPAAEPEQYARPLTVPDDVRNKWLGAWRVAQPANGLVAGPHARAVFARSGLSADILAKVWTAVDQPPTDQLSLEQFMGGMMLITLLRDGTIATAPSALPQAVRSAVSAALTQTTASAAASPRVASPAVPAAAVPLTAAAVAPTAAAVAPTAAPVAPSQIGDADFAAYRRYFDVLDTGRVGRVNRSQSRALFQRSGLAEAELDRIWELADVGRTGTLAPAGFAVAMHLIRARVAKQPLPEVLPAALETLAASDAAAVPAPSSPAIGAQAHRVPPSHSSASLGAIGAIERTWSDGSSSVASVPASHPAAPAKPAAGTMLVPGATPAVMSWNDLQTTSHATRPASITQPGSFSTTMPAAAATLQTSLLDLSDAQASPAPAPPPAFAGMAFSTLAPSTASPAPASANLPAAAPSPSPAQALSELKAEQQELVEKRQDFAKQQLEARAVLNQTLDEVKALQAQLTIERHQLKASETQLETLQAQLDTAAREKQALEAQLAAEKQQVSTLERDATAAAEALAVEQRALSGLKAELAVRKAATESLAATLEESRSALAATAREKEQLLAAPRTAVESAKPTPPPPPPRRGSEPTLAPAVSSAAAAVGVSSPSVPRPTSLDAASLTSGDSFLPVQAAGSTDVSAALSGSISSAHVDNVSRPAHQESAADPLSDTTESSGWRSPDAQPLATLDVPSLRSETRRLPDSGSLTRGDIGVSSGASGASGGTAALFAARDFQFDATFDAVFGPLPASPAALPAVSPAALPAAAAALPAAAPVALPAATTDIFAVQFDAEPAGSTPNVPIAAPAADLDELFGTPPPPSPPSKGAMSPPLKEVGALSLNAQPPTSQAGPSTGPAPDSPVDLLTEPTAAVETLMSMGFSRKQSESALARYDNDLKRATNYLLEN